MSVGVGNTQQNPPNNVQVGNFSWRVLAGKCFVYVHTQNQNTHNP